MTYTMAIETNIELDKQFLMDILVTAVEGGINYWCALSKVERDKDLNVLSFAGYDHEDESEEFKCDLEDVAKVLGRIVNDDPEGSLPQSILAQDACEIDAECADYIVQLAIFDEIVYG